MFVRKQVVVTNTENVKSSEEDKGFYTRQKINLNMRNVKQVLAMVQQLEDLW